MDDHGLNSQGNLRAVDRIIGGSRHVIDEDVSTNTIQHMTVGNLSTSAIPGANVSITNLSAGTAGGSEIFVGIQPTLTTIPAATTDFSTQTGLLQSITVRGAFSNTQIAAWNIGNVRLNNVQTANSGTPFGVAADTIKSLRAVLREASPSFWTKVFASFSQVCSRGRCDRKAHSGIILSANLSRCGI